ncbi:hypothetical protein ACWEOE_23190 [Amycolatopsis sp. NPDC004368]
MLSWSGDLRRTSDVSAAIHYRPGTRWPSSATPASAPRGGVTREISVEPRVPFLMKGLGYSHPDHAFGAWHGGLVVSEETFDLASLDPTDRTTLHTQLLSTVRTSDGRTGVGLFEHAAVGRHDPSGLPDGTAAAIR